ncbi:prepilin peptidase [Burkholderia pseudomultivorans]|uniref:Prepilin leader peptidase/N-methyltransferase n=1 Tax=Burkholderia pseudomultivorans TaxID=1207504 RepID=A0ABU2ECU5_9BURK|nr:A24 family peptidase [Burkholderia pseudomultivorans]MDR8728171.1 Type 4 prepilin-like proteins leader peptide-processing enzyme [Burkholderia pseudomultivorans]MDR8735628.1 Type 4 prepilin-like proteins leader peptide-processing enzyme [Burkholderia pseudomultivorans]MDR8741437.1 Type 4 prepilin-like proteins leader peptide-processing enzyme [Burkholderia pseudomultivorans]MDR8757707.1 Type 4 prepilin-like proteins leader peptide-processing enzyme [Burkholderia pseudomultivorans]MDR8777851
MTPLYAAPDSPANALLALAMLPPVAQYAFAVVLGLCVGSFVNVVVHRLPVMMQRAWQPEIAEATGNADVPDDGYPPRYDLCRPRSACPHCGHVLRAWENIPLVSYLLLRGRCRQCGHAIGLRYPLVELAGGLLAAGALAAFGPTGTALAVFGLCAALLAMSAIDIRTGYLPDSMTLPLLWAGLALNLADTLTSLRSAVIGAMAGYLFLWSIYWLFKWLRGIEGIGFGDLKLLAALGAWMGWAALPQVVLFAAVTGAIVGLVATWRGRMRFEEPIPFGPFLAAGGVATLFFGTPFYSALGG